MGDLERIPSPDVGGRHGTSVLLFPVEIAADDGTLFTEERWRASVVKEQRRSIPPPQTLWVTGTLPPEVINLEEAAVA